jgi:methyl-branched lipid omega-hydroxylase
LSISPAEVHLDNSDFAERVPHEVFQRMRDEAPVLWYDWEYGKGFWSVTRYDDIVTVLKDWRTYSSETGGTALEDLDRDQVEARKSMLDEDPPEHSSLRAIVNKGFTPRAVAAYEDLLRELTRQILDDALPKGEFDFIEEVAKQLPIQVLCRILGVPLEDDERMIDLGDRMIGNTDPDSGGLHPGSPESNEYRLLPFRSPYAKELFDYGHALAAQRRADPKDDLVSKLVTWEDDEGRVLTEQEFDTMFLLLVVAGNETTRNAISHGALALSRYPEQREKWWSDFDGLAPTAVEEMVRWASPVVYMRRTLTQDVELSGTKMAAGDKVSLWYNSANRDESKFANPWAFDVARDPNPHLGYGGGGAHFCLGANLARREIRVAFDELRREIPDIVATGEPARLLSQFIHGIKSLPVAWTPPG